MDFSKPLTLCKVPGPSPNPEDGMKNKNSGKQGRNAAPLGHDEYFASSATATGQLVA